MKKTKEQISHNMRQVKNKDSAIELALRKELWSRGLRYRKNVKSIFGKPDIAFIGKKIAVFCDSEFWHGYAWEIYQEDFRSNQDFWFPKIERNIQRDIEEGNLDEVSAQELVDKVRMDEKPDVVIVATHSGVGSGDGSLLEGQGMDLFNSLSGVDFVICAHDHRPVVHKNDTICLLNAGSHCRNLGHGRLALTVRNGRIVSRVLDGELINIDRKKVDQEMKARFAADYKAVKEFTTKEVGTLLTSLRTRDSYTGMSDYLNLLHTLSLGCAPAQISLAAPLTFDGYVKEGTILFNDLFTIYPYENQLYVIEMTGKEVKDCLEYSYNKWINTIASPDENLLQIVNAADPRTGSRNWSFVNRSYNFDSAGGLCYDVDVTKPMGSRIRISYLADGTPFDENAQYNVAVTSYRANGGGGILRDGAGIDTDRIDDRVVEYYPEIRDILYDYLVAHKEIDPATIGDRTVIGEWSFVPEDLAAKALEQDMKLVFSK